MWQTLNLITKTLNWFLRITNLRTNWLYRDPDLLSREMDQWTTTYLTFLVKQTIFDNESPQKGTLALHCLRLVDPTKTCIQNPNFRRNINVGQHFKFVKWKLICHRLRGGQWILVSIAARSQVDCAIKWMRLYLYDFVHGKAGEIHLSKLHCALIQSNPTQIHSP